MSLISSIQDLVTRIGTEVKTMKSQYSGNNSGDLTALKTGTKASLLAAINELYDDATAKQDRLGFTPENPANKGIANGYAGLDGTGKVPASQLPSFVDDVLESASFAALPATGATGVIYVTTDTNITYRWSGTAYVEISSSLALGETPATAYRGDRGKTAYDHTSLANNPHAVTKAQVGLGSVDNTPDTNKPVSTAQQTALSAKEGTITAGTTSQFWRGDKTWQDFTAAVRAVVLTGLSTATNAVISASDTMLGALGKLQAQISAHEGAGGSVHPNAVAAGASGFMSGSDKTKLDGMATGANNYTHPSGEGNHHVPATGTTNNLKVLKAGSTAGSEAWGNVAFSELTGKPTSISGYAITDAYTKTETGDITTNFVNAFNAAIA